jgi:hypothetical protein
MFSIILTLTIKLNIILTLFHVALSITRVLEDDCDFIPQITDSREQPILKSSSVGIYILLVWLKGDLFKSLYFVSLKSLLLWVGLRYIYSGSDLLRVLLVVCTRLCHRVAHVTFIEHELTVSGWLV